MSKPSIFSKDYEKEMKKRRKRIFLLVIAPIIGLAIFLITDFNGLLNKGLSIKSGINNILLNKPKNSEVNKTKVEKNTEEDLKPQSNAEETKTPQSEVDLKAEMPVAKEIFIFSLPNGQEINVEYSVNGAIKTIVGISDHKEVLYDISPSKQSIVIQSVKNQDLLYFHVDNISKDITKKTHESSAGQVFPKEDQLKKHPNYLWSIAPRFIDEENIAYVSELPWINEKAVQYIWKVNLKDMVHMQVKAISGKNIVFKNISPKGLETIVDGNAVYVTPLGKVIK